MGERSQIYVRYNGKLILARYYQWNYGERMISRARWGIEKIKNYLDDGFGDFAFNSSTYVDELARYFDVNFDMKDIVVNSDIFKEYENHFSNENFVEFCFFRQGNNNGKLLIDIAGNTIKYAFLDDNEDVEHIMSARHYMHWDNENWRRSKYIGRKGIRVCNDNIKTITSIAQLMTKAEVEDYLKTEEYFGMPVPF